MLYCLGSVFILAQQIECKIPKLATVQMTKHLGQNPKYFYNDCTLKANDFLHYLKYIGSFKNDFMIVFLNLSSWHTRFLVRPLISLSPGFLNWSHDK